VFERQEAAGEDWFEGTLGVGSIGAGGLIIAPEFRILSRWQLF